MEGGREGEGDGHKARYRVLRSESGLRTGYK